MGFPGYPVFFGFSAHPTTQSLLGTERIEGYLNEKNMHLVKSPHFTERNWWPRNMICTELISGEAKRAGESGSLTICPQ